MRIFIGSDHGGYPLKNLIVQHLAASSDEVTDCGTYSTDSADYPDFALAVGRSVQAYPDSRGILLCRSGEGMEIAANKLAGIRAALVWRPDVAAETRRDNDANVLVLPADFIGDREAIACVDGFLGTRFSGEERHIRRLEKLTAIEKARYES